MADEFDIFGKLSQLTPPGKSRDPKEIPIGKEVPRRKKPKKKEKETEGANREDPQKEEQEESGNVVDIII